MILKRLFSVLAVLAVAVDLAIVGYFIYLAVRPYNVLEVQQPDKILNPAKVVHPGEVLVYQVSYCKYLDVQAKITRNLTGPVTYFLPDSSNNIATGCRTALSRNTIIPLGATPGKYRLDLSATYQVNPIRTVQVSHSSEEFEIVAR